MRPLEISSSAGRAQVDRVRSGWVVELTPPFDGDAATALLASAIARVAHEGGGLVRHWVRAGDPVTTAASLAVGLAPERELRQLRRRLPVGIPFDLDTRAFVPGRDEAAWLEVNNRAFEWHPEQGGWTLEDLLAREAQPWFDPAGFLLHEAHGTLAGFCWTKVHREADPPLGEIYVIAIDPSAAGTRLGHRLVLAGLDHLHRSGLGWGMLYVDAGNTAGVRLYEDLGFEIHHADTSYAMEVPAA